MRVTRRRCLVLLLPLALGLVLLNLTDFFMFLHDMQHQQQEADYARNQQLLRSITSACAKQQETFIYVDRATRQLVVTQDWDATMCPLIDVALGAGERGVGMCTDVALYLVHSDARMVPRSLLRDPRYDASCGNRTARLFLETMYADFFSAQPGVRHLMQVNSEHLFLRDAALHSRIDTFLCKTHFCQHLMQQHIAAAGLQARSLYMAHSSIDFSVGGGGRGKDYNAFLHVKGKSGLKHTMQLLSCWRWHPGFPQLTVVGQFKYEEYKQFLHLPNIRFMPRPTPNDTETELVPFDAIQAAMNHVGVHICVSEREGFGHYLNEARALSALVITTDHPPMNEMVQHETGVLVRPYKVNSYGDLQLLAPYGDINAFVSPFDICGGVVEVLEMPIRRRRQLARRARLEYLAQRRDFLHQLQELSSELDAARREAPSLPPAPVRQPVVAPVIQEKLNALAAERRRQEAAEAAAREAREAQQRAMVQRHASDSAERVQQHVQQIASRQAAQAQLEEAASGQAHQGGGGEKEGGDSSGQSNVGGKQAQRQEQAQQQQQQGGNDLTHR